MRYYVNNNAQNNGDHEVHRTGCVWLDRIVSKTYLGDFESCGPAKTKAKAVYSTSDGCAICCPNCHTG